MDTTRESSGRLGIRSVAIVGRGAAATSAALEAPIAVVPPERATAAWSAERAAETLNSERRTNDPPDTAAAAAALSAATCASLTGVRGV